MTDNADNLTFTLGRERITLPQFLALAATQGTLLADGKVTERIARARNVVERHAAGAAPVYGLNTGLGANLGYRIPADEIEAFQLQLLRGRSVGTGPSLPETVCRGVLLARIITAARAYSGLSPALYEKMQQVYAAGLAPVIASCGSIGAGDLVLNAQMGLTLCGEGEFWVGGEQVDATAALQAQGIEPLKPEAKDAMVLANHSSVTVAQTAQVLGECERLMLLGQSVTAMAAEAYNVNPAMFAADLQALRPASGQEEAAAFFRRALEGFTPDNSKIQDALSFRVVATLFGTARTALAHAIREWEIEANAAAENPTVMKDGSIRSSANFHTPAISHSLDSLSIAVHHLANASAQRSVKLMTAGLSGLPKYLSPVGGASAGLVPMQKTIAALLAESRFYAQPAGLDAMVVSDMVEDVASQSMLAAQMLGKQLVAVRSLIGIEALVAAQGLDLRGHRVLGMASGVLYPAIRGAVDRLEEDRAMGREIERVLEVIEGECVLERLSKMVF